MYPNDEQMIAEGGIFHRTCFKCNHASAHQLTLCVTQLALPARARARGAALQCALAGAARPPSLRRPRFAVRAPRGCGRALHSRRSAPRRSRAAG